MLLHLLFASGQLLRSCIHLAFQLLAALLCLLVGQEKLLQFFLHLLQLLAGRLALCSSSCQSLAPLLQFLLQFADPGLVRLQLLLASSKLLAPLRHLPTHLLQLSLHLLQLLSCCLARCLRCR